MHYKELPAGRNVPTEVYALIEISRGGGAIKYEFDRQSGAMIVDRLRQSSLIYPVNYGCIPQTLSEDGDPLDILVLCDESIQTGTLIPARPVGLLLMDDEKGHDVKIISVPADHLTAAYQHIQRVEDIPEGERKMIEHFFKHYKDLDGHQGRWSTTAGWQGAEEAYGYILKAIERAKA